MSNSIKLRWRWLEKTRKIVCMCGVCFTLAVQIVADKFPSPPTGKRWNMIPSIGPHYQSYIESPFWILLYLVPAIRALAIAGAFIDTFIIYHRSRLDSKMLPKGENRKKRLLINTIFMHTFDKLDKPHRDKKGGTPTTSIAQYCVIFRKIHFCSQFLPTPISPIIGVQCRSMRAIKRIYVYFLFTIFFDTITLRELK